MRETNSQALIALPDQELDLVAGGQAVRSVPRQTQPSPVSLDAVAQLDVAKGRQGPVPGSRRGNGTGGGGRNGTGGGKGVRTLGG